MENKYLLNAITIPTSKKILILLINKWYFQKGQYLFTIIQFNENKAQRFTKILV